MTIYPETDVGAVAPPTFLENNENSTPMVVGCRYCLTERVKAKDLNKHFIMCPDYPITYPIDYEAKFTKSCKKGIDSKQI